jgi:hypothetical protein
MIRNNTLAEAIGRTCNAMRAGHIRWVWTPDAHCNLCGVGLDEPGKPETTNCGGDCLKCMADIAEDPDCIEAMREIRGGA